MENNVRIKLGQQSQFVKEKENELLHKEKEHLKQSYKDLFDSIKMTRVQTKDQNDSLMAQLNKKSNENVDVLAQIQKNGFAITTLKNELRKLAGNSVNTKYIVQSYKGRTQSLVAEKTDISENRASRNFDLMIIKWRLLKITLQAPFLNVQMTFEQRSSSLVLHQMTSDHNRSELGIQDHSNEPSSSKLVPKVVPLAVKTATSRQELELLFHHHMQLLETTVVRLGINPMIQPEPGDLPKDNPKLEIAVLRVILLVFTMKMEILLESTSNKLSVDKLSLKAQDLKKNNSANSDLKLSRCAQYEKCWSKGHRSQDGNDDKDMKKLKVVLKHE
ncbi:hypothetical protein Tco_0378660 [Tanacetum coccineum]